MKITVTELERRTKDFPTVEEGWYAVVATTNPNARLQLSRLDGENNWIVDALFVNGVPDFVMGFGARFTILQPASAAVADLLDNAVVDAENMAGVR